MPAVGSDWSNDQIEALVTYTKTCRSGVPVATRVEAPVVSYRADWRRGRITSWLTTVDHKRIGILYIVTALGFFAAGGLLALHDSHAARHAQ